MKMLKPVLAIVAAAGLVMALAGCSSGSGSTAASGAANSSSSNMTTASAKVTDGIIDTTDIFSDRDLEQTADTSNATQYTVTDGQDITITEEGVYVISGSASNVTIYVNAADENAKIQIVLDGVSITNTDAPVIYVQSADKVFVTTTSNESTLAVTGTFAADGDTTPDAVIYSKDDLTLNGVGTLNINSTDKGVSSKDDLKITGGTYNMTTTGNSFDANDSIAVCDGTFNIESSNDGFHAKYTDDDTVGYVYISGGTFNINAADNGIRGTTAIQIDGGTFDITAVEALEATYIQINDGTISISASDDGINATAKSTAYDVVVDIRGGNITIVMGSGDTDAIDANGSIYISGGNIDITAQSPFDYDQTGELTGGTVTVNGEQVTELENQFGGTGGMGGGGDMGGGQAPSNQQGQMQQQPGGGRGGQAPTSPTATGTSSSASGTSTV